MTKKEKQLWLEAIGKMRINYKQYPLDETPPSCEFKFLCEVAKKIKGFSQIRSMISICGFCLWKFEGKTCTEDSRFLDTTRQRLARLDRWEARILKGD